jgi:hypothetical protein
MPYFRIGSDLDQKTNLVPRQVFQQVVELLALSRNADLVDNLANQLAASRPFALIMEQASKCKQIDERHVMNGIAMHEHTPQTFYGTKPLFDEHGHPSFHPGTAFESANGQHKRAAKLLFGLKKISLTILRSAIPLRRTESNAFVCLSGHLWPNGEQLWTISKIL